MNQIEKLIARVLDQDDRVREIAREAQAIAESAIDEAARLRAERDRLLDRVVELELQLTRRHPA